MSTNYEFKNFVSSFDFHLPPARVAKLLEQVLQFASKITNVCKSNENEFWVVIWISARSPSEAFL